MYRYPLSVEISQSKLQLTKVYPNPAASYLHVENEDHSSNPATVWLYDLNGRVQGHYSLQQQLSISTQSLPAGNYILKISHASGFTDTHCITVQPH